MTLFQKVLPFLLGAMIALPASANPVEFNLASKLPVGETEISYAVDLSLTAKGPTRIRANVLLDLRDLQKRLPEIATAAPLLELCGFRTILTELSLDAKGDVFSVAGELRSQFFKYTRLSDIDFQRGELQESIDIGLSGTYSVSLRNKCAVFEVVDLKLVSLDQTANSRQRSYKLEKAKSLLLESIGLILEENPFCPSLPPELASLDPIYESGSPREIGDGGLGVAMVGSVDVSPSTILDIVKVLQREGQIPGPP